MSAQMLAECIWLPLHMHINISNLCCMRHSPAPLLTPLCLAVHEPQDKLQDPSQTMPAVLPEFAKVLLVCTMAYWLCEWDSRCVSA